MERINYLSISIVLIFFSLFFITLFLIPKYQGILKLKKVSLEYEKKLEEFESYLKEIDEDFEKMKEFEKLKEKISSAIPSDPSIVEFFNFIENLSAANGLYLKDVANFSISESKEIPSLKEIKTEFTLSGSYFAFKNFVYSLERSARMVRIEGISFKSEKKLGEKTPSEIFDFSLKVKLHSL